MVKVEKYEKLNKPGLWFVCSEQPATDLKQYIYDFAVESGLPIVVYSDIPKKEIQNAVIDLIKTKCIENAENENERDWLEQEMTEYDNHGFFWYPEELNDFIPNGFFWNNYVFFDEFKILSFTNSFSHLYLIDNLSELSHDYGSDYSRALTSIEQEAVEYKKTIIVFVSPNDSYCVCSKLKKVTIDGAYLSLGKSAFLGCSELEIVKLPSRYMTIINPCTFEACSSLHTINIPENIEIIGERAFCVCLNLERVIIKNSNTVIETDVFRLCKNLKEIVVPKGSLNKFSSLVSSYSDKFIEV